MVRAYRMFLSPWLGSACRFTPTCSAYSLGALQAHGAVGGVYLSLARLARCHPWCHGGDDPVPERLPKVLDGALTFLSRGADSHDGRAPRGPSS
ncbi:MAG: membrane protein insertion efficiency factor YidD [Burkholderiales bacterium]|nr:membrane protein insertion efficiency factor YidD [Burkholderiales bacterium]